MSVIAGVRNSDLSARRELTVICFRVIGQELMDMTFQISNLTVFSSVSALGLFCGRYEEVIIGVGDPFCPAFC